MTTTENAWDTKHYKIDNLNAYDLTPAPFLVEKVPFFKREGVRKILDAGFGQGRNCSYLVEEGFDVYGVDSSSKAMYLCGRLMDQRFMSRRDLNKPGPYHLYRHQLEGLKDLFAPGSLDAVISVTVLTHILKVEPVLDQFYHVLKLGGYLLADFANLKDSTYESVSKGERIDHNTFLEEGTTVVYRTKSEVKNCFLKINGKLLKSIR